ncbi:MAG: GNAT family N-acetyltransferase [Candidatus Thiodiazotropha sp. (ex Lucinoma kastoroae)]|nr:GNAT family N-acetyltransferase [Candidatus Thiodiazotropha sp. (ex Lucinoma kastoroae)]
MDFNYKVEKIYTNTLSMEFYLVPWDTKILERPVAEISHFEFRESEEARRDFKVFTGWCDEQAIKLINCRIPHNLIVESMFLQEQGFRFIELNYRPRITSLQELKLLDDEIDVEPASEKDKMILEKMAGSVFKHGRFHQDPRLGGRVGNIRYKYWLLNAFELPYQKVYKFVFEKKIIAFFVVEYPEQDHCFWSLTALAPDMQGMGLGRRVWRKMMYKHQLEGINTISTSISSHNTAVQNLYNSLAFRFPTPSATFHWLTAENSQ